MVICLELGADLHMAQLMPLPLTVSCFSKIQIGFTFLVLAHPGSPGQRADKRVCVCVRACSVMVCIQSTGRRSITVKVTMRCYRLQHAVTTVMTRFSRRLQQAASLHRFTGSPPAAKVPRHCMIP